MAIEASSIQGAAIPNNWVLTRIGDVATINEEAVNKFYPYEDILYIDIASVVERNILEIKKLSLSEAPSRARRILRDGDFIISTVRPNLKHYAYINNKAKNLIGSTGFAVIRAKKCDSVFLYYLLTCDRYTEYLMQIAEGQTSAYPAFNTDVIENTNLFLPPIHEQYVIANILSTLDEKIELNNRINKTLEEMAQAIFKSWFVDFEPFKDGEFENSELGKIPKGWKVERLGDYVSITRGASPRPIQAYVENGVFPWVKIADATSSNTFYITNTKEKIIEEGIEKSVKVYKGDLILSNSATCGLPYIMGIQGCIHDGWLLFREFKLSKWYIFWCLRNALSKFNKIASGSVQDNLNTKILKDFKIIVPEINEVNKFDNIINCISTTIFEYEQQSKTLTQTRDALLPKLISGEIRVPVEIAGKEAD